MLCTAKHSYVSVCLNFHARCTYCIYSTGIRFKRLMLNAANRCGIATGKRLQRAKTKNIASKYASKCRLFNINSQSTFVIMCVYIIRPGRKCLLSHHSVQLFLLPENAQLCSAQLITAYRNTHECPVSLL